jgi:hypothetical protein
MGRVGRISGMHPPHLIFFLYSKSNPTYQIPLFGIPSIGSIRMYFGIRKGIKEKVVIM